MAQGLPRTRFNGSTLVRLLTDPAVADAPASKQSIAERLGEWLDFNDALALFSALNAGTAGATQASATSPPQSAAARQAYARVRAALLEAITADGALGPGQARVGAAIPAPPASADAAADFAPYHRYYLARQRDMAASIAPLRANVRAALSRRSAALKRLAVVDAVLDQGLAARERDLLNTVPGLLARRFERLQQADRPAEASRANGPDAQEQPAGWLAVFRAEMQAVLRAELELRLQPVAGLIAALDHEVTSKQ